jgi:glycosyltransferase involved in cell wall biosynthesis
LKVSGFTFVRNALKYDYPVTESIKSVLPICDEMIVSVGNSADGTRALIDSIGSPKVRIFDSVWDDSLKEGGKVLAYETDKAFGQVDSSADWCFYIQADEVLHEKEYDAIRKAMEKYKDDERVEGLLFKYIHFYGTFDYVGDSRQWYSREIRVIRNDKTIHSYRDAQGFRKEGRKLDVKPVDAFIYHYGWVKHPETQLKKHLQFEKLYQLNKLANQVSKGKLEDFDYSVVDSLAPFLGSHPAVMAERIKNKNWQLDFDIGKKNFSLKKRLLYLIEKKTGKRLFEYQNFRVI